MEIDKLSGSLLFGNAPLWQLLAQEISQGASMATPDRQLAQSLPAGQKSQCTQNGR